MSVVRYFGREYRPALFRRGWRGLVIRCIAWLVAALERFNERRVMHYLARVAQLPPDVVRNLNDRFDEQNSIEQTRAALHELIHTENIPLPVERPTYRAARAARVDNAFAAYMDGARRVRYLAHRGKRFDGVGDVEPTPRRPHDNSTNRPQTTPGTSK